MTAELSFTGYRSIEAGPADPMLVKWCAVKSQLDAPSIPLAPISDLNVIINRKITYAGEPAGCDVWQTPMQTWTQARGDCEDYAILKYAVLRATIPVRVVVGEIKSISGNRPHAWCAAYLANEWHVLDSLFDQIIPVSEYINWLPLVAMHDDSVLRFGREFTINEMMNGQKG